MSSDLVLSSFRCAAAMLNALPSVRVRARVAGRTVLEAARPPIPDTTCHHVVPACRFRTAVVNAYAQRLAGRHVRFMGVEGPVDPTISYCVGPGEVSRPGGLVRVTLNHRWIHAAAIASGPGPTPWSAEEWIAVGDLRVRVAAVEDEAVGVNILHVATDAGNLQHSAAAFDALVTALGRVVADEIESYLSPRDDWTAGLDPELR